MQNIFNGLVMLGMAAVALPAAAVSPDSTYSASRTNTAGSSWVIMPPYANHFCYLSRVGVRETDTGGELAMCRVYRSGTVWVLSAYLGASSDADVYCSAECYNN
jgi:hypothetical protein